MASNTSKTGRTRAKRIVWLLILLFDAAFCAVYYQLIVANVNPAPLIPSLTMPTAEHDARNFYLLAADSFAPDDQQRAQTTCENPHALSPTEKQTLIRENAGVLAAVRLGLHYVYIEPLVEPFDSSFPYLPQFQALACLLCVDAQTKAEQGDWAGAADAYLEAIQFGGDVLNGLNLKGVAPSVEMQAMGRRGLSETLLHLDAAQAKQAARRMEAILDRRVPFDLVMDFEKWYGQTDLYFLFRHDRWRGEPKDALRYDPADPRSRFAQFEAHIALNFLNKRHIIDNYTRYINQCINNAHHYYPNNLPLPPKTDDFLTPRLLVDFRPMQALAIHNQLENVRLELQLALRAYRLAHSAYPATLASLAPDTLAKLPTSPQTASRPIHYTAEGDRYTLDIPDDPGPNHVPHPVVPYPIDSPIDIRLTAGG